MFNDQEYTAENPLSVFTAFAGYNSQCLALERLKQNHPEFEYDLVGWSEIDKYAIQGHNQLFPQWKDRNYGDITSIDWTKVPDFDLFTFSSPCQDFSMAGRMKGGEEGSGTRSSLLWHCEEAIKIKKPKYLFMENVKNLVSEKFRPVFVSWCQRVETYGYKAFWRVINAKDYGVPQNRERVFVVFIREDIANSFSFPPEMKLTRRLVDVLETNVPDNYYEDEKTVEKFLRNNDRS